MAKRNAAFCQKVRNEIKKWEDYWHSNNLQFHEFMDFIMGNQWKEDESKLFERYNKVPLVMNKLAPLSNALIGEQVQNTPNLQVSPDDTVPEQTAEIRAALIKEISLNSDSKLVYQNAFEHAVIGGFGAYALGTEYTGNKTFDQDIKLFAIKDPTKCYWDLSAESPCKTDGMYAGYRTRMSRKKMAGMYGRDIERRIGSASTEDGAISFADDDSITFIDHFRRKYKKVTIYQLSNGEVVDSKELKELERQEINGEEMLFYDGEMVTIINQRETYRYKIIHYQIAGDFILEEEEFPSEQLPVPFVDQHSYYDRDGKQICRPFFKDARDAQRFINYLATQSAYLLKVSRYDQFMVSKQNVRSPDTQVIWKDPTNIQGGLIYDNSPDGSKPEQLRPPELSQSLTIQYERALSDIKSSTGMYATQLGEQGNEISGNAIDARTKRGSYNTYIPFNSLNRAIAVGGQIINEMIPKVYDAQRLIKLTMSDDNPQDITLNKSLDPYGEKVENDMTKGDYKIRLLPGPSYEGQKAEGLESLNMVLAADKSGTVFPMIADLYVENLPLPNSLQLRNRLKTMVPPEIIEAGKTGKPIPPKQPQPSPEQIQAMAEMKFKERQLQQKDQEIAQKQQELQVKTAQAQHDSEVELQKLQTDRMELAASLQEQELRYAAELHRTSADLQMAHADNMIKILTHSPKHLEPKATKNKKD